jgi:hypothetical protein
MSSAHTDAATVVGLSSWAGIMVPAENSGKPHGALLAEGVGEASRPETNAGDHIHDGHAMP